MYQYDLEHMAFKTAAQSYAWHWSVVDEERYTNQVMKLMTPIYIALHAHGFYLVLMLLLLLEEAKDLRQE
jgi:hypothetical protein